MHRELVWTTAGIIAGLLMLISAFAINVQRRKQAEHHLQLAHAQLLESEKLKDSIMETELAFLKAQIKPHFLFNALSAIANVCEKDSAKAGDLILDLANYLRSSMEPGRLDQLARLYQELEFIRTYIRIEQARFGPKIQIRYEIGVPMDLQLPVLQPLVENAVRHGISKKAEGGTVTVHIIPASGGLRVTIEDTGPGMPEDTWKAALTGARSQGRGVGLLNIHTRLLRLYGRGLAITSQPGQGTRVCFWVPTPPPFSL